MKTLQTARIAARGWNISASSFNNFREFPGKPVTAFYAGRNRMSITISLHHITPTALEVIAGKDRGLSPLDLEGAPRSLDHRLRKPGGRRFGIGKADSGGGKRLHHEEDHLVPAGRACGRSESKEQQARFDSRPMKDAGIPAKFRRVGNPPPGFPYHSP